MKRLLLLSIICFLPFCGKVFPDVWIPISCDTQGKPLTMEVLKDDASSYQVEVTVNGLYDKQIINKQGNYHRLSLGTSGTLLNSGEPLLPLITRMIAIPTGTKPSVSISEEHWMDIEIGTILPAQTPPRNSKTAVAFHLNEKTYNRPYLPPVVRMGEEQEWRHIKNVGVYVCPFKYYPKDNRMSVLSKFVLKVDFERTTGDTAKVITAYEKGKGYGLFDNTVYLSGNRSQSNYYNNNYLIIVGNSSSIPITCDKMIKFKIWKALKGFDVNVVSLSSFLSSAGPYYQDVVKQYIRDSVGSGGHVLFIGDDSSIPMAHVHSFYNSSQYIDGDYWYGYGTGSGIWMADIAVGRFSTNSAWEFGKMVDKTIRYESTSPGSDSILLVAHRLDPYYYRGFQHCCEEICNAEYTESVPFIKAYGAGYTDTGAYMSNAYVISKINQGVPIVCYLGYGYPNYWGGLYGEDGSGDPSYAWNSSGELFYSTEVGNMNSNSCAVFLSSSTNTGNISVSGNMLEAFTRDTNGVAAFVS